MSKSTAKSYRVYRQPRRVHGDGSIPWGDVGSAGGPGGRDPLLPRNLQGKRTLWQRIRTPFKWFRRAVYLVVLVTIVYLAVIFLQFRSDVAKLDKRLPAATKAALSPTDGPSFSTAQTTLVLGSDERATGDFGAGHSDSIMIVRSDPGSRRYTQLSIPRDLRVNIPGHGSGKINSAFTLGGAALTIKTVEQLTSLPINHVMIVDFGGFKDLVNKLGGIDVNNAHAIKSNSFDGHVWRFRKGENHLDGRHALAYSRVRENSLDSADNDLTRGNRQQQVLDAIIAKLSSVHTVLHSKAILDAAIKPLTTDVPASTMMGIGFSKWWATDKNTLRCRLGGMSETIGGQDEIIADDLNRATVQMFLGRAAPVAPDLKTNQYAPGCTVS